MFSLPILSSVIFVPRLYSFRVCSALMARPLSVFGLAIKLTMISVVCNGFPRQFILMDANILCSILFHLLVPGGKWETYTFILKSFANFCSSTFHSLLCTPLLPPPSAFINNAGTAPYLCDPITSHHLLMLSTAKAAVSWLIPTFTKPSFAVMS